MTAEFDIVVRSGRVVDGSGQAPFTADVAIRDGLIAELGAVGGRGREEIDAAGLCVTPGFVDIHTHYDGQAIWDSRLASSSWHGTTTVLAGNCGIGFAPAREADRSSLIALMEGIEDLPEACLHEGLDWAWESYGDYLSALDRRAHDVDVCSLLPHAALRIFVMGERALNLEAASPEDIARMRELTVAAMRAGAFGFSTSRAMSHSTLAGDPMPTRRAEEAELHGIAQGLRDAGHGFIQLLSTFDEPDVPTEFGRLRRLAQQSGIPLMFSLNVRHDRAARDNWRELLRLSGEAFAAGIPIWAMVAPRPTGALLGLTSTQNPFAGTRTYHSVAHLPLDERVAVLRDPEVRRRITTEDPLEYPQFAYLTRFLDFAYIFPFRDPVSYTPAADTSMAAIAAKDGRRPPEVAYDMMLEDGGRALLLATMVNYPDYTLDAAGQMLASPNVLPGLGDGGAHVGFVSDASFTTFLLTYWGRDRQEGILPLEHLVRLQTREPARFAGLPDRGVVAPGYKADINLLDFEHLGVERPYQSADLPGGGTRLLQKARGYVATIKSGQVTYRNGEATDALPGVVVRGPQPAGSR
jgi:N-acyl-D-aspartate/D-glutamate deacylase